VAVFCAALKKGPRIGGGVSANPQQTDAMFQPAVILGNTEREILLATFKNNKIRNVVQPQPNEHDIRQYARFLTKYRGNSWEERKPITGIYNCAGHVWASRRTSILEPAEWEKILDEDGYRPLRRNEKPSPGDIAIYVRQDNSEIWHVARVYGSAPGITSESEPFPRIISKWGPIAGEFLHLAHDVPFGAQGFPCDVRYHTDRP
jgi:hypothetical protein